jgi:hypothetical protein
MCGGLPPLEPSTHATAIRQKNTEDRSLRRFKSLRGPPPPPPTISDSRTVDPQRFYLANCRYATAQAEGLDKDATTKACSIVGGTPCRFGCFISGKESAEARTRSDFSGACKTTKAGAVTVSSSIRKFDNEAEAKMNIYCA